MSEHVEQVMLRCDMVGGEQFSLDSVVPRSSLSTCFTQTTIATIVLPVTLHQMFAPVVIAPHTLAPYFTSCQKPQSPSLLLGCL